MLVAAVIVTGLAFAALFVVIVLMAVQTDI
jgi:hypothetical protein